MTALHYQRLVDVAALLRSGELSAEALTQAQLDRIVQLQPDSQAYVQILAGEALAQAQACDQARAEGRPLGLLHGVPVAVKDLLDLKGTPTGVGTTVMAECYPEGTATVVRRLRAAGAVILGKLRQTEGAFSEHHPELPAPRNPWGSELWTGVSSSGSGVATATGQCFGSLGTDTGGSVRFPSAACGIVGLKPSYGRVSRQGAFPLAESLDHIGPMTRSVADAARMLRVLAGHDRADPNSLSAPVPDYEAQATQSAVGMVVGWDPEVLEQGVEPGVVAGVHAALARLQDAGVQVCEVALPDGSKLIDGWAATCGVEAALAHSDWFPAQREAYGPVLAALLDLGTRTDGLTYATLERERERYRQALDRMLAPLDAVLVPAMPFLPPPLEQMEALQRSDLAAPITFTAPFNYSGHPSVTLPMGLHDDGRPRAVQFVGPMLGEGRLLRLAAAIEGAFQAPAGWA